MTTHECVGCGATLDAAMFQKYRAHNGRLYRRHRCRSCGGEQLRSWKKSNVVSVMLHSAQYRARKLGVPFSLTSADIVIPDTCPALGIPLFPNNGAGHASDHSPSLDRIVPENGYVRGNVCVISNLANSIKNRATPKQIAQVARWASTLIHHCIGSL